MNAMKCDRCGAFYTHYAGERVFRHSVKSNGVMFIETTEENKYFARKYADLCPDCMRKLQDFMFEKTEETE